MNQLRIPANKVTFDPVTNEYLINFYPEKIGTYVGMDMYIDFTKYLNKHEKEYITSIIINTLNGKR